MTLYNGSHRKVRVTGNLVFDTAFHIGSGKEGELASNMGVLKDSDGFPLLPGSTLKGNFRSLCERVAPHLGMSACLLDSRLSGTRCVSDENYRLEEIYDDRSKEKMKRYEQFHSLESEDLKLNWLGKNVCDVCNLFGSPLKASRIFFSDGELLEWARTVQVRDGVCIDRDSETARPKAKYNFEVIPRGAVFSIIIDIDNPNDNELALIGAALAEWEMGFRIGGFTSRGLGWVRLEHPTTEQSGYMVESVDYSDTRQLQEFLLHKKMTATETLLKDCLEKVLEKAGGANA